MASGAQTGSPLRIIRREFLGAIIGVAIFSLVANLLLLTPTLYMLQVYDRVMVSGNGLTLLAVSLITLFLFFVLACTEWARSSLLVRAGVRFDERLNSRVFKANFVAAVNRGQHNALEAFNDLLSLRQFVTGPGVFAFFDAPWMPVYVGISWLLHPLLGQLTLLFAAVFLLAALVAHWVSLRSNTKLQLASRDAAQFLQSKMRNAEAIESMGMLGGLRRRWLALNGRQVVMAARAQDHAQRFQSFTRFLQAAQQAAVLAVGALLVIRGELSLGAMIAANVLMARALQPVQALVGVWRPLMAARLSYRRLGALLTAHPARSGLPVPDTLRGQLELRDLVARAEGRESPILAGLTVRFEAGETIAVLGPSGAGKSTLLRCLLGLWPHTEGEVRLDGEPVSQWNREQLGARVGYLPQDVELLDGTVAENIARFGELDSAKIVAAAQAAGVHEMILRLPQGYNMPIGPSGNVLSAGQRQRIGLARALYGNPALIMLDEPNANLDDVGEMALLRAVAELKKQGTTVIFVSHRGALLNLADRVLLLKHGRIEGFGQPERAASRSTPIPAQPAA